MADTLEEINNLLKNERSFDKNSFSYIDDLTLPDNQKIINTALGYNSAKKLPKIKKKQAPPPTPTQNDTVLKPAIKTSSSKTSPKLSKRVKFQTNNNHFQSKHYGVIKNEQKLYRNYNTSSKVMPISEFNVQPSLPFQDTCASRSFPLNHDASVCDIPGLENGREFMAIRNARVNSISTHEYFTRSYLPAPPPPPPPPPLPQSYCEDQYHEVLTPPGLHEKIILPSTEPQKGTSPFHLLSINPPPPISSTPRIILQTNSQHHL